MKQRSKYEAPSTQRVTVELEQGFMGASMVNEEVDASQTNVTSSNQEIEGDYDFTSNEWK